MIRITLILLALLCLASSALAQSAEIKLPAYKKVKLANGMTLMLMEKHQVPFISFSMIIKAGSTTDPEGKEGVASLTANLLRKGTKTRTSEELATQLDQIGGSLDFDASLDYTVGSAEFLKKDINAGLDLVNDVLRHPTFPQAEVDKLQKLTINSIKSSRDEPPAVIGRYFNGYLYGNHPYSRPVDGDEQTIAAITREDIANFYERHYGPANMILAVAGDFQTNEMEKLIEQSLGKWDRKVAQENSKLPQPNTYTGKKLLVIDKPDATQTYFMIGNLGVSRNNPDRVGIEIVNTFFGGRFTSLLNTELRIKTGLTYGARSFFRESSVNGPFAISTYTRNDATEQAIDLALDVLKRLHEKGMTEEQLKSIKQYIKGQFAPDAIETSNQLAGLMASLEFYGLDEHEINDFFGKIDAFTLKDATRIIKDYFPADNLVFVMIGKTDVINKVAKKYATTIETRPISKPSFK